MTEKTQEKVINNHSDAVNTMLSALLETNLLIDAEHTISFLRANFGLDLEAVGATQRKELFNTDEVQAMDCWPAGNSIKVINDTLVIKLSDNEEG